MERQIKRFAVAAVSGSYLAAQVGIIETGPTAERPDCVWLTKACEYQDGQEPEGPSLPLGTLSHSIATTTTGSMTAMNVSMRLPDDWTSKF
jgi:hypothetical protein